MRGVMKKPLRVVMEKMERTVQQAPRRVQAILACARVRVCTDIARRWQVLESQGGSLNKAQQKDIIELCRRQVSSCVPGCLVPLPECVCGCVRERIEDLRLKEGEQRARG